MKKTTRFLTFVLTVATLVLGACGAVAATPSVGGGKAEPIPVAFIGVVDSVAGDQWVISGTTVTVDPTVVRDGPFGVGDQVKVEGAVNSDGSFVVSRVELPTTVDLSTLPQFGDSNSNDAIANDNGANANVNDANVNADNTNSVNSNDDNSNTANSNDANINDDNSNSVNSNDDNSNAANSNDDNGNDDNSSGSGNDDGGGNNSGGGGNDDSGGGGSGKDGGDDDGGNGNDG